MTGSTIIVIAVCVICGLVFLWCIKNGNNIKFAKKEKKGKPKKAAEDKFKDVIPKEKKEKPKKQPIIKNSLKEDIKKKDEENKTVEKITIEDFKNNDLSVPIALLSDEEKTAKAKEVARQGKTPSTGKDFNFNFDNEFKPLKSPSLMDNPFKFDDDLDSLFGPPKKPASLPKDDFKPLDFDFLDDEFDFDGLEKQSASNIVDVNNKTGLDKFEQVFGAGATKESAKHEVVVGDVLSSPRARVNKINRRKYF